LSVTKGTTPPTQVEPVAQLPLPALVIVAALANEKVNNIKSNDQIFLLIKRNFIFIKEGFVAELYDFCANIIFFCSYYNKVLHLRFYSKKNPIR
jgi:hypothetical protein